MVKFKFETLLILLCVSLSSFAFTWQAKGGDLAQLFKESHVIASNVMVGDSITQFGPWQDLFSNTDIANRGIAGDTSTLILQRMDSSLGVKPKKAFLMFGINDFGQGADVDQVFNNYEKIITSLQHASVKVIISSTIKNNGAGIINKKIERLNLRLQRLAKSKGITYIDINEKLSDANGLQEKYTIDGIHLNLDGYREWAKVLSPLVNKP
jgi:lysophospholipase L1-like esterase